jgi:outer membrane protein OmpA-like peptidoglycan-associated protein
VAAGTFGALALLASSCSGQDPAGAHATSSRSSTGAASTTTPAVAPALETTDGFSRLNLLPDPVAEQVVVDNGWEQPRSVRVEVVQATTVGSATRVVLAWDAPSEGDLLPPAHMRSTTKGATPYEIGLRLYDPVAGTVSDPLRTANGDCLCSKNTGRYTDSDKQSLFWADFPAPANDHVVLLMGEQVPPVENLPIASDQPALDLSRAGELADWVGNAPPATVGEGASAPVVTSVRRTVRTFGGAEDSQVGKNADVSLPADVLFAFDSSSLTAKAKQVLASAAPKLASAAKGQRVQVVGHTDDQGTPAYNNALSLRRAKAVAAYLAPRLRSAGITLAPVGKGESEHLVPNLEDDGTPIEANRQRNRRVSFVFARADATKKTGIDAPKPLPKMPVAHRTTASPEVQDSLASVLSSDGTVRVDVTRLQRSGKDLWVALAFTAVGAQADWGANPPLLGPNPYGPNDTLANVEVTDAAAKTVAPPLSYGGGPCLCSEDQGAGRLHPKPLRLWAVFPAPDHDKVTLRIPGAGQVVDLPIS